MTKVIQYSVPVKYVPPVVTPSRNAFRVVRVRWRAISSGARASQAQAGYPKRGKLSARRTPDASASA
jgi:hypothetical protein